MYFNKLLLACICLFSMLSVITFAQSIKVYPNAGQTGTGVPADITGSATHFNEYPQKTLVKFVNNNYVYVCNKLNIASNYLISFTITLPSYAPAGNYTVVVHDSLDGDITNGTTYLATSSRGAIASVIPDTIGLGVKGQKLYIQGYNTYFDTTSGKLKMWLQNDTNVINTDRLYPAMFDYAIATITVPANTPPGQYTAYVADSADSIMVLSSPITIKTVHAPEILSLSPDTVSAGNFCAFEVRGNYCHFTSGNYIWAALIKGNDTLEITYVSHAAPDTAECQFLLPLNVDTGYYDLLLFDLYDGYIRGHKLFHVLPNRDKFFISAAPLGAYCGAAFSMQINTHNTGFRSGGVKVWLAQGGLTIKALSTNVVDDENLYAYFNIPANVLLSVGEWTINVSDNADTTITAPFTFSISYPTGATLIKVTPDTIVRGQQTTMHVYGLKTNFSASSVLYLWNGGVTGMPGIALIDKVISPEEIFIIVNPDTNYYYGQALLYYEVDSVGPTRLDNPVYITDHLGIENQSDSRPIDISAWPNPFRNSITLSYNLSKASDIYIRVFDMMGRQVYDQKKWQQTAGQHQTEINLDASNRAGLYFIEVNGGDSNAKLKLIKLE